MLRVVVSAIPTFLALFRHTCVSPRRATTSWTLAIGWQLLIFDRPVDFLRSCIALLDDHARMYICAIIYPLLHVVLSDELGYEIMMEHTVAMGEWRLGQLGAQRILR